MVETDRGAFIRQSMRQSWAPRTRAYTREALVNTAAHTAVLLRLVPPRTGERVLDVASGPGTVAIEAAKLVGPQGSVLATDLTPEWAEVIAERSAESGVRNVTFRSMGAETLDLPDESFAVAYCQFGLMFVPDPVQALREMRRVLLPGGRLGIVVWSTVDKVPHFAVFSQLLAPHGFAPPVPPEQQMPTPLALGGPGLIDGHVAAAGFRDVHVARHTLDFVIESPEAGWQNRVEHGQPNVQEAVRRLSAEARERLRTQVIEALSRYVRPAAEGGDGQVRLPSEAIYVSAVR